MVTVAVRALGLECLVKVLDSGRSRSQYIFTDSDCTQNSFRLRVHSPAETTPERLVRIPNSNVASYRLCVHVLYVM
jgi:hypothetical protein